MLLFKSDEVIAEAKAASLAARIADHKIHLPTGEIRLSAAWGVSICSPDETVRQILDRADQAMYAIKPKR